MRAPPKTMRATRLRAVMPIEEYRDGEVMPVRLGEMSSKCKVCKSLNFEQELVGRPPHFQICCKNGKVPPELYSHPRCPQFLADLLIQNHRAAKEFRAHARAYNSALAFMSFGANLKAKTSAHGSSAPPVCILHGAMYHYSYTLEASPGTDGRFAQLYLYDHAESHKRRTNYLNELNADTLDGLAAILE